MENYSGLLPFLWKTFTKPQQRRGAPETVPLPVQFDRDRDMLEDADDECFLHPELATKSLPKSPGMFGLSPGRSSLHKRRHSTGLSTFSLPKLLQSSHSQRAR